MFVFYTATNYYFMCDFPERIGLELVKMDFLEMTGKIPTQKNALILQKNWVVKKLF